MRSAALESVRVREMLQPPALELVRVREMLQPPALESVRVREMELLPVPVMVPPSVLDLVLVPVMARQQAWEIVLVQALKAVRELAAAGATAAAVPGLVSAGVMVAVLGLVSPLFQNSVSPGRGLGQEIAG